MNPISDIYNRLNAMVTLFAIQEGSGFILLVLQVRSQLLYLQHYFACFLSKIRYNEHEQETWALTKIKI